MKQVHYLALTILCCLALVSSTSAQCSFTLSTTTTPVICGGNNGSIDLTVSNGTGPFTYMWMTGPTTEDLSNLVAGTYTVTVTDALACTATAQATVQPGTPLPVANAGPDQILNCVTLQVTLGNNGTSSGPNFTYAWSGPGINGANFNVLHPIVAIPGQYTLLVTDVLSGCTASDVVLVLQDANFPTAVILSPSTLTCVVTSITLSGSGSSTGPNFVYQWSTANGNIVSGSNALQCVISAPGLYTLTVTNTANLCTSTMTVAVNQDALPPVANAGLDTGIPCGGSQVTLNGAGSSIGGAFVYSWTGSGITTGGQTITPVVNQPGTYSLVVTNAMNGCTASDDVKVFAGPAIPQQNFTVTNVPCLPGQFGAIDMAVDFGTAPYTYLWSNNSTTEDINNLTAGTYTVTATDATGCSYHACVVIQQGSTSLNLTLSSTLPTCFGSSNGTISLTASGGAPPYTYAWDGPSNFTSTQEDLTGLQAGNYVVTVTDAAGCTRTAIRNIQNPNASVQVSIINSTCSNNGAININVVGNMTPPFTYDWSNDGPETPDNDPEDLTGIGPGSYNVTITSSDGCTLASTNYTVSGPTPVAFSAVVTPVPCGSSGTEGAIDLTVSGGTPPYNYTWSNGASNQDPVLLPEGTYTVTVTNAGNCTSTFIATVYQGGVMAQNDFTVVPASCGAGATDGSIALNTLPSTGQGPFSFEWIGPFSFTSTSQNITGLPAGDFSATITDAMGCKFLATVTVGKLPGDLNLTQGNTLLNCDNAVMDLNVSGGTQPYEYMWSNGFTLEDLSYSITGTYTVTVTDATGCSKTASFLLTAPISLTLTTTEVDVTCNGADDGAINLVVQNGSAFYSYAWSNTATTQNLSGLSPGTYCVTVFDNGSGCTAVQCAVVTQPDPFTASMTDTNPPTCTFWIDGSLTVALINAVDGPFNWEMTGPASQSGSTSSASFTIQGLAQGTYCVTITNTNGCTAFVCATLTDPPPVVASIEALSITCNSAVLRANITGGTAPFSYSWEGMVTISETTPIITVPLSGIYQAFILDANGCGDFSPLTNITLTDGGNCGYVQGRVIKDSNENCVFNTNEPGLAGWLVRAEGADTLYGITDPTGQYLVNVPTGTYTMAVMAPNNLWIPCPGSPPAANVTMPNDTIYGGDFLFKPFVECPALTVSIGTSLLRRCFSNNYYDVTYCNLGTSVAENAYVDVTLDPFLIYVNSNIPSLDLGNNGRRFFIGNIAIGGCGDFYIRVTVNCSAVLGQTHCTEAHIFPDTLCNTNALWSGSDLKVRSVCNTDSLRFVIKNAGTGNMTTSVDYIVIEDAVMVMQAPLPLLAVGDSITLSFPANGSTWRVEVDQDANHPYPHPAAISVEGCTTNSSFSTGYVTQFSNGDPAPTVDIDCTPNTGSYDPNDKRGYPIGYGAVHYIRPGTEIEYLIRFQNTGTDTAFTVRVTDTLSSWIDPTSIHFGASSHPYRYDLSGGGIVQFIFDNIMLPDSNVNEAASHGYVKFMVTPHANAPLETVIENTAAIYFDYNDPVITNTTFHRLGENFITVGLWQPVLPNTRVIATPNPFSDETVVEVTGLERSETLELHIFDFQGIELNIMQSEGTRFHLKKGDWSAGMYFFKILQNGKTVGSGKLIAQ